MSEERAYYRPVTIVGLLLVGQAFGLAGLVAYRLSGARMLELMSGAGWSEPLAELLSGGVEGGSASVVALFLPPATLMLVSGAWFLLRRGGWLVASVGQGLCLGVCLLLYSGSAPAIVYPIMAYCVLVVMYLNSRDVRTIMHAPRRSWSSGGAP